MNTKRKFIDILDANEIEFKFSDGSTSKFNLESGELLRLLAFKKNNPTSFYIFEGDNLSRVNLSFVVDYKLGGWMTEDGNVLSKENINHLRNN